MAQYFPLRLFNYSVECRVVDDAATRFFVVCKAPGPGYEPFEMAPTFAHSATAMEIASKATRGDEYSTSIPCVPYGDGVPRKVKRTFAPGRHEGAGPGNACPRCGK